MRLNAVCLSLTLLAYLRHIVGGNQGRNMFALVIQLIELQLSQLWVEDDCKPSMKFMLYVQ